MRVVVGGADTTQTSLALRKQWCVAFRREFVELNALTAVVVFCSNDTPRGQWG
jgi:hypothetical protein